MGKVWGKLSAGLSLGLLLGAIVTGPAVQNAVAANSRADSNQVILPALHGLRFVSSIGAIDQNGFARPGITVDGPYMLYRPGIYEQLEGFLGRPLRQNDLQRITAVVAAWYAKNNRPFVDVAFPPQDVSKGVVQAVVTEFRVGKVEVKGNNWFSSGLLRDQVDLEPGDPIDARHLNDDLNWMNQNDFREVTIVAQKSDTAGATDLVLLTKDEFPLRFNTGYANNGAPLTGRDRWTAGVTWGDALWLDQQFSYQFTSNQDFWLHPGKLAVKPGDADFVSHSASYIIPFSWHNRLVLSGAYSEARPNVGNNFAEAGVNWQISMRYVIPFAPRGWPSQELQIGYDFKRSNNDLQFGGAEVSNVTTDIDQFTLNYTMLLNDRWGQTRLSDRFEFSPGNLTPNNTDKIFQPSVTHNGTPFAKADYIYDDASAYRLTSLPGGFGWIARIEAQWASAVLLPSERLEAGGIETVRGYDEYAASGSEGLLMTQEFRTPALTPLHDWISPRIDDQLQFDAFWDFAYVRDQKVLPGANRGNAIDSAGAGFQYALGRYFSARCDYGWQLQSTPNEKRRGAQIDVSLTLSN